MLDSQKVVGGVGLARSSEPGGREAGDGYACDNLQKLDEGSSR